ncbi:hypothetical protein AB0J80_09300 [Actinoplanes sp. NPDC049548]|uniref:hypothetical protein n=1 Tax=Actinoplanes sp. NPDC049548 TaxID=3155152 RepID=UPI003432E807
MPGTNWDAYNLPSIWTMLQPENACNGADRVLSWDSLAQEVRAQHRRLERAAEDLAAVWSPDKNASAEVFLRYVKGLAASMNDTLVRAENTRAGLRGVIEAIAEARQAIAPMVEEREGVADDWIPRWADHAEDEYDDKARQAMRTAEAAIADHSTQIQPPSLFQLRAHFDEPGTEIRADETGTHGSGTSSSGFGGSASGGSGIDDVRATPVAVPVPHHPPPAVSPDLNSGGTDPGASVGSGPGLAGVLPTAPSAVGAPGGGVITPPTVPTAGVPGGGALPGAVIGAGGLLGLGTGVGAGGTAGGFGMMPAVPGGKSVSTGRQAVPVRTAMPSGTVIGANGSGAKGGVGARNAAGRQSLAGTTPTARGRRDETEGVSLEGKADQAWDVLDGVAPVIEPDTRPARHDPGPGVIGMPR